MSEIVRTHPSGMLLTFLVGAATGAAVALLTAPQSGRDTRRKLMHLGEELADRAAHVPPALKAAYLRASEAGKEAFLRTLEERPGPTSTTLHS
jgi:gas vesicle protein